MAATRALSSDSLSGEARELQADKGFATKKADMTSMIKPTNEHIAQVMAYHHAKATANAVDMASPAVAWFAQPESIDM